MVMAKTDRRADNTGTVFFVGFSFYIPAESTARIAVSVNIPLRNAAADLTCHSVSPLVSICSGWYTPLAKAPYLSRTLPRRILFTFDPSECRLRRPRRGSSTSYLASHGRPCYRHSRRKAPLAGTPVGTS